MGTQVIGLHVVDLLAGIEQIDIRICIHGSCIIMAVQACEGYVAVDDVVLLLTRIGFHIFIEDGRVVVEVEGKLRVVEMRVLADVFVPRLGGCSLEGIHSRNLVARLDVAVGHFVVGDLPDGVRAGCHPGELVHSPLVVSRRIHHGACIE